MAPRDKVRPDEIETTPVARIYDLAGQAITLLADEQATMSEAMLALIAATLSTASEVMRKSETAAHREYNRRELVAIFRRTAGFIETWNPDRDIKTLPDALREACPVIN